MKGSLTTKQKLALVALSFIGVISLLVYIGEASNRRSLDENRLTGTARVTGITTGVRGSGITVNYHFTERGRTIYSHRRLSLLSEKADLVREALVNLNLPVIIDSTDYNNNLILISFSEFSQYSIPYPDSLTFRLNDLQQELSR